MPSEVILPGNPLYASLQAASFNEARHFTHSGVCYMRVVDNSLVYFVEIPRGVHTERGKSDWDSFYGPMKPIIRGSDFDDI